MLRGQYGQALQSLDAARAEGMSEAAREMLRGVARLLAGSPSEAIPHFELALDLDPALLEARFNRGVARLAIQQYIFASADFTAVFESPAPRLRGPAALHNAIAFDRLGRLQDAQKWIARAREADPNLDAALLYAGYLHERRGELTLAGDAYRSYLQRNPASPLAALRFAITAQRAGFHDTARKYFRSVIKSAPDSHEAIEARKFLAMWE
ncbi:MAG TPA: tetratricopeptide repeat protein [Thermoanaerobaculia bacterium]|nr:tetratricopeptide repeat protein [Thermoanaerobaculia bacterium]